MKRKDLFKLIYPKLKELYPDAQCELNFTNEYTLMVAVILSAQCTDKRVNEVTKELFNEYPNFVSLSMANIVDVEKIIKPCGFYRVKAKNIVEACKMIVEKYDCKLPKDMKNLVKIPGIGRKTANVLLSNIFGIPALAVDTHVFRVSNRIGLVKTNDVFKCEIDLKKIIDKDKWSESHHLLVLFGRYNCKARNPNCKNCLIKDYCGEFKKWNGRNLLMVKDHKSTLKG